MRTNAVTDWFEQQYSPGRPGVAVLSCALGILLLYTMLVAEAGAVGKAISAAGVLGCFFLAGFNIGQRYERQHGPGSGGAPGEGSP